MAELHDDLSASGAARPGPKTPEASDDFIHRRHTLPSGLGYTTTTGRLVPAEFVSI
ncbi:hypothetical protein [Arthrobacter sp. CG_A4]|uniref:hypothetical protein n=1 Tax=Arthrobacter sp. CG_A4 TaxID=3071706 RepID=UPI002E063029|nr:hypothetical protein [Arthrobacter sp. CG_A4]